jgi:glutaconate CoA-transferase subunit B
MPSVWSENKGRPMQDYSAREMMAIAAARRIRNGDIVFCGTGISMLAAMAAKHIHAPRSVIFFETGAVDSALQEIPLAVADPRVMYAAACNGSLASAFATMQNSRFSRSIVGILGAAQIDPFGNLNSTVIGDYHHPRVRFSGSGGAADVASFVGRTIIFMQHDRRKFVPRIDYITSPGHRVRGADRRSVGLPPGGPEAVISDLAVMGFDDQSGRMVVEGTYEGVTCAQVRARTGFSIDCSRNRGIEPPSTAELQILRQRCDPQRLILG